MSPYQLNPFDINPMRDLLNAVIDFERVRQQQVVKLFLSATNVRTGKVTIFTNIEITADHVLASECLPFKMRAPKIGGEYYWDGGFMGNPAIFPVIYECELPRRSSGSHHPDRASRASDKFQHDTQPHGGDQLEFIPDEGDAVGRFLHAADRRR